MKAFGVGCFHFSVRDGESKTIQVQDYVAEVVRSLESLTTVSGVRCHYDDSIKHEALDLSPPNPIMRNGGICFPQLPLFNLEFHIYIPSRIQAELINLPEEWLDTGSENFKITVIHDWHGPLSYVEALEAGLDSSPSTSVQIVRKYLFREFSKIETFLFADFIGPSPFHANFFFKFDSELQEADEVFNIKIKKKPGYDNVTICCPIGAFPSEEIALSALYDELAQEIAFFYDLQRRQSGQIKNWLEIEGVMHSILDFENESSKKKLKDKLCVRPKLFRRIFKDIGLFKAQSITDKSAITRFYNDIYGSGKHAAYLQHFIDKKISESSEFPVNEAIELIRYFEQKTSKMFELSVVVFAAMLGGLIGSVITVSFS